MDEQNNKGVAPLDFDPRHVETFLKKISADRDAAIEKIRVSTDQAITTIRREAYRNARKLARSTSKATRERVARERDRYLHKVRAELTREHWTIISELREQVLDQARTTFTDAWKDPEQQWRWCNHWVSLADPLAKKQKLHIRLGLGGNKEVMKRLEQKLKNRIGKFQIEIDRTAPAGIAVCWPDHYLDGTLISHCQEVSDEVVNKLMQILSVSDTTKEGPA